MSDSDRDYFLRELPVITVTDHYYWPYFSKTRSRVLDSLSNLERYPVCDRYIVLRERKISIVRSANLDLLLQRDDRFRRNGTLVPRGSPIFNHTERFFGQGRWCPWLFLIVINDKKKRPAPGCSSRCAQSMPDVADRYINCVHGNSRTKLAMD